MSGHADSIRRAREVPEPERKEGVEDETTFEEEWPEDEEWEDEEWEDDEEEWEEPLSEKLKSVLRTVFKKALGPLVGFVIDTAAIVAIPTVITLSMIALFRTAFIEVYLATGAATLITMFVSDFKTRLLQRLRLRFR
jgi:hypothetical protein